MELTEQEREEGAIQASEWVPMGGNSFERMVLRHLPKESPYHPYVTHVQVKHPDRAPYFVLGRYFFSLDQAEHSFGVRQ